MKDSLIIIFTDILGLDDALAHELRDLISKHNDNDIKYRIITQASAKCTKNYNECNEEYNHLKDVYMDFERINLENTMLKNAIIKQFLGIDLSTIDDNDRRYR